MDSLNDPALAKEPSQSPQTSIFSDYPGKSARYDTFLEGNIIVKITILTSTPAPAPTGRRCLSLTVVGR
jgi:hypothetical protein